MTTKKVNISGMCCNNCVTYIEGALSKISQIENSQVQLEAPQVVINLKEDISDEDLIKAINAAGHYTAEEVITA